MKRNEAGFTLVELMIVVAIIGIISAIALPAYTTYMKRSRMTEVVLAAAGCRTHVSDVFLSGGASLPAAGAWGCESASGVAPTKFVRSMVVTDAGTIVVTADNIDPADVDGRMIELIPYRDAAATQVMTTGDAGNPVRAWKCAPATAGGVPAKYLPGSCRG